MTHRSPDAFEIRNIEDKPLADRKRLRKLHLQLADVFTAERPGKTGDRSLAGLRQTRYLGDGQLRRRRDIIENKLRNAFSVAVSSTKRSVMQEIISIDQTYGNNG